MFYILYLHLNSWPVHRKQKLCQDSYRASESTVGYQNQTCMWSYTQLILQNCNKNHFTLLLYWGPILFCFNLPSNQEIMSLIDWNQAMSNSNVWQTDWIILESLSWCIQLSALVLVTSWVVSLTTWLSDNRLFSVW